jgi:hypothetical protein
MKLQRNILFGIALSCIFASTMTAQNNRSAVSINGFDTNPCTVPQPCRTFGAAIAVTNSGGEVLALDSGGYGPFSVTKAVTVQPIPGAYAGIAPSAPGSAISVNAGANDRVVLRNLTLSSQGTGLGINFTAGAGLFVEGCTITGFIGDSITPNGRGINVELMAAAQVWIHDTVIRGTPNMGGVGVQIQTSSGIVKALIDGVRLEGLQIGSSASTNSRVTIRNSIAAGNSQTGFAASLSGALNLENCAAVNNDFGIFIGDGAIASVANTTVTSNSSVGIEGENNSTIRVSNCTITRNGTGVLAGIFGSNVLLTRSNNTLEANGTNGTFTGTFSPQ